MRKLTGFLPLIVASAALVFVATTQAAAKNAEVAEVGPRREAAEPAGPATAFKVYEWGVATQHWQGGEDTRFDGDVPAAYYEASEVPVDSTPEPEPQPKPDPKPDPGPIRPRKPVLYFDCARNVTFDLSVIFSSGKMTWMYPKPTKRSAEGTAVWSGIRLHSDSVEELRTGPAPKLLDVPADHWANYSREASNSSIEIGGERERFLFYEGEAAPTLELDIALNDKGDFVLRNFSAYPIYDFGATLRVAGKASFVVVPEIPSASGETPGEVTIGGKHVVQDVNIGKDLLAKQCEAAGLTAAQAKVFNRCWYNEFFGPMDDRTDHCYWYRRDPRALDASVALKLKLPAGFAAEFKRVGYVYVHGVDYDKLADFDKLVTDAVGGNTDSGDKLKKAGIAAMGAVRRALLDKDLPLKKRLELAKLLKSLTAK
ncbi:MAG: hypothetical protein IT462_15540 [Planctomycetes bacterium]|nr:hypothetical protein [Planctomycetota bacterium]